MVLVMPAELRAARGWKQKWEHLQLTVQHRQVDRRPERERWGGGHGGKGLVLERGLAEALWQSLNKAAQRSKEQRERREQESSRARTPQDSSPAFSWLPAGEWSSHPSHFNPSFPHPFFFSPLRNDHQFPLLLWEIPQSNLCLFYFYDHMGPGAFCYLVTGLWIRQRTSLRVPLWRRPLEWIFNIW